MLRLFCFPNQPCHIYLRPQKSDAFIVRFIRKDGRPDEEYYYHTLQEAETHKKLFDDDDSDLYERIEIIPT